MQNFKKYVSVALMATMIVGNSVTAFAADNENEKTAVGKGANEGHVDKHMLSVTLPTVPENSTPFNYTIDPERLVEETTGTKYSGTTFTDNAKRDGVYFLGGTSEAPSYDNTSVAFKAISESSVDVELTVEVEVVDDGSVALVNEAPSVSGYTEATVADEAEFSKGTFYTESSGTYTKATAYSADATYYKESDPELYLALKVDDTTTVLESGKTASKTVTIAGIDSNYETTYDGTEKAYKYTKKQTLVSDWNTSSFSLTGVASKASAENVKAPTLNVTWRWTDPAAAAAVEPTPVATATMYDGVAYIRLVANQNAVAEKVTSVKVDGNATTNYAVSGPIAISGITGAGSHTVTIVYDGTTYSGTVTVN